MRLRALRIGGVWYVSDAAIEEFVTATTAAANAKGDVVTAPSVAPAQVPDPRIERELDARGL